jgi:cell division protein FtsN
MKKQRGGFFLGLIVGLLVGLAVALGVALRIANVPVPFVNKVPQRTAEQDSAEAEKNKNWDPNSGLHGKHPARPSATASGTVSAPAVASAASEAASTARKDKEKDKDKEKVDPAALLAGKPEAGASASTKGGPDALMSYFVQAGAYGRMEDAEQQRGRVALLGLTAKITEREQSGRTVYRVRLGPFDRKDEATTAKEKLDGAGVESALVQVQK